MILKNLLLAGWLLSLGGISFFITYSITKEASPEAPAEMPSITVEAHDHAKINLKDIQQNMVIILFRSNCAYSKQQAKHIFENITVFKKHVIYFISYEGFAGIERFAEQSGLVGVSNVRFLHATGQSLAIFNYTASPSIYIYSHQGKLIKNWANEISIESMLKYIQSS